VTQTADFSGQVEPREVDILNVDDIPEDNVEGDSSVLIAEQKADLSLASYWKAAEAGRPDVVVYRSILYHIKTRWRANPCVSYAYQRATEPVC